MSTQENPLQQLDINHWILRVVAFIIDSIIIYIVYFIIFSLLLIPLIFAGGLGFGFAFILLFPFLLGILYVIYFVVLDVVWGGTVGKRILGLRVQMTNGSKVTFDKALIRNISKIYWIFLILDWLLGVVSAGNDKRQKYTDRIAGTTVVKVQGMVTMPPVTSTPPPPPPKQGP